jgi:hypothetical protein
MSYIKKKSAKQEKRTAKEFGGKTQVASGALWGSKGDVRTGGERTSSFNETDFLIENKFTDKPYYIFKKETWDKINGEAIEDNFRTPLMQVDIQDLHLVILDVNDYVEYFEGYDLYEFSGMTNNKSFLLDKKVLEEHIEKAKTNGQIPAFKLTFTGQVGVHKQLNLVIMLKDDFIYR